MKERVPLVAGNWKLHKRVSEAVALVRELRAELGDGFDGCEVAVAPVATALSAVAEALRGSSLRLAGQNVYHEPRGAFTGEVSSPLLADVGCQLCIVGHSERRQLFGETDAGVRLKVQALLAEGLVPIVCVGETLAQREAGETLEVVLGQVVLAFQGLTAAQMAPVVIAYEPVWAIGTGRTASPEDAEEAHAAIRGQIASTFGPGVANSLRILYGGSVKPENAAELLSQPDIDGALVGGASLETRTFVPIVRAAL